MNWWDKYIGLEYLDLGRDMGGVDCWGLVWLTYYKELGVELPMHDMEKASNLIRLAKLIRDGKSDLTTWISVDLAEVKEFDVIIMKGLPRGASARVPMHCGVATGSGTVLHVDKKANSRLTRFRDDPVTMERAMVYDRNRAEGAYRYVK